MKKILISFFVFLTVLLTFSVALQAKAQPVSLSGLVNLFISLGIISPEKATAARAAIDGMTNSPETFCYNFDTNLDADSSGSAVRNLHAALSKEGFSTNTTNTYNETTASAVTAFQEKYMDEVLTSVGLSRGTGYVGPSTRKKLNNLYGCVNSPITNSQTGGMDQVLSLSLVPNHEDSSIKITVDLSRIADLDKYSQINDYLSTENGTKFKTLDSDGFFEGSSIKPPFKKKIYDRNIANLKPDSEYEFCLSGFKNTKSIGIVGCKKIKTNSKKPENNIIFINYDVYSSTRNYINDWIDIVKNNHPLDQIHVIELEKGMGPNKLLEILKKEYAESNLKNIVLIGWDLPVPKIKESTSNQDLYYTGAYKALSNDNSYQYYNNYYKNEISISVIHTEDQNQMDQYFLRLIDYYRGKLIYEPKLLIADAMILKEGFLLINDFVNEKFNLKNTTFISGITDYMNLAQASVWKKEFKEALSTSSYKILIINTHGQIDNHYPSDGTPINADFIRLAKPDVFFTILISCNVGNFMTENSPMVSYIFSGRSLAGLASELPFLDANGLSAKYIYKKLNSGMSIGDIGRKMGLTIFGDPFLKL